jgi:hypothetical protein
MAGNKPSDRRIKHERRHDDLGPPAGMDDRRIRPERRHPDVEEVHVDDHIEIHGILAPEDRRSAAAFW